MCAQQVYELCACTSSPQSTSTPLGCLNVHVKRTKGAHEVQLHTDSTKSVRAHHAHQVRECAPSAHSARDSSTQWLHTRAQSVRGHVKHTKLSRAHRTRNCVVTHQAHKARVHIKRTKSSCASNAILFINCKSVYVPQAHSVRACTSSTQKRVHIKHLECM